MKIDLLIRLPQAAKIIQVKNDVVRANALQLREIERYKHSHPSLSMEKAARKWVAHNAANWRAKHPLEI
jgi:hypothetical protein